MNCLVVIAHPLKDSLCNYLANETIVHLRLSGHEVVVKNLYEEGFEPALKVHERAGYYSEKMDVESIADDIEQLEAAEMLVLVFPTWWFGFPAILKGWFDRVWAPGYAYLHAVDNAAIKPNLKNLKRLYVVTTLGSPWWVDLFVMWKPIARILRVSIMQACTTSCKFKILSLYKCENVTRDKVEKFVKRIKTNIRG